MQLTRAIGRHRRDISTACSVVGVSGCSYASCGDHGGAVSGGSLCFTSNYPLTEHTIVARCLKRVVETKVTVATTSHVLRKRRSDTPAGSLDYSHLTTKKRCTVVYASKMAIGAWTELTSALGLKRRFNQTR